MKIGPDWGSRLVFLLKKSILLKCPVPHRSFESSVWESDTAAASDSWSQITLWALKLAVWNILFKMTGGLKGICSEDSAELRVAQKPELENLKWLLITASVLVCPFRLFSERDRFLLRLLLYEMLTSGASWWRRNRRQREQKKITVTRNN